MNNSMHGNVLCFAILVLLSSCIIGILLLPKEGFTERSRLPISAGILTHFAPKTLRHTLETYRDSGFLDLIEDTFVVIQQSDRQEEEKKVCDSLGIRCVVMSTNGRMASGFRAIYENARTNILLPLENDFAIYTTRGEVSSFLTNALYFLTVKGYNLVRGRSRANGGVPNYAVERWSTESPHTFIHSTFLSECIFWEKDPELVYPSKIQRIPPAHGSDVWYISSSGSCNYTNNPFLCTKTFFAKAILPHLVDGENIENRLMPLWSKEEYSCVFGPGLFTHDRSFDGHS